MKKVKCKNCEKYILQQTADSNEGLCMPCFYRSNQKLNCELKYEKKLECKFSSSFFEYKDGAVIHPQINQIIIDESSMLITVILSLNSIYSIENGSAYLNGPAIILTYETSKTCDYINGLETLRNLKYIIKGLRKIREYQIEIKNE